MNVVCSHCLAVNRVPPERAHQGPKCGKCGARLLEGSPVELDQAKFERYMSRGDLPVLVDFWASWCGPCKMMAPIFAQVGVEFGPRVIFAKVNTEQEQALAARFGIRSIPSLVFFRGGREVDRVAGAMDAASLRTWVNRHLS